MGDPYNEFFKAAKEAKRERNKIIKKKAIPKARKKLSGKLQSLKMPEKTHRKRVEIFPWQALVFTIFGLILAGIGYIQPDFYDELSESFEISWFAKGQAEDAKPENKAETKGPEKEKDTEKNGHTKNEQGVINKAWTEKDASHFSKLNDRKVELDMREAELNELERELHKQKKDIEGRINKLEELRMQISKVLKERVDVDQEKVNKLVEFYSNMKPLQAANIISTLNEDLAVEILGKMKKKNAADILNLLKPEKAQSLTEMFAGYKRR